MTLFSRWRQLTKILGFIASLSTMICLVSCASVSPASPHQGTSFAGPESEDYILGPEDVIQVIVWENDKISREVTIRPDGKISLPLIGDVQASGYTASQLQEEVAQKLAEYKETPEVAIIVKEVNSYGIYIMGEVIRPGKYILKSRTSVLQVIAIAGGFTPWASKNKITLIRRTADGTENRIQIKYDAILSESGSREDLILRSGDTLIVP